MSRFLYPEQTSDFGNLIRAQAGNGSYSKATQEARHSSNHTAVLGRDGRPDQQLQHSEIIPLRQEHRISVWTGIDRTFISAESCNSRVHDRLAPGFISLLGRPAPGEGGGLGLEDLRVRSRESTASEPNRRDVDMMPSPSLAAKNTAKLTAN